MEIARITGRNTFQPDHPSNSGKVTYPSFVSSKISFLLHSRSFLINFNALQFRLRRKLCFTKSLSTRSDLSIGKQTPIFRFFLVYFSLRVRKICPPTVRPCARHSSTSISFLGKQFCHYDNTCRKLAIHMDETVKTKLKTALFERSAWERQDWRHMATMGQSNR